MHTTGRVIEHSGGIDGFLSFARYYPDDDVTVVVLQNALAPPGPGAITIRLENTCSVPGMSWNQRLLQAPFPVYR